VLSANEPPSPSRPITNCPLPSRSSSCHWTAVVRYYCNSALVHIGLAEGKRSFGGCKSIWEDNIEMEPCYLGSQVVDEIHLAEDGI